MVRTPSAVEHCRSCLVFLTGSFSDFALARIDSIAPELTRGLTSRVLECLSFLPSRMNSLKKIIRLKFTCFSFLLGLFPLIVGFCRVFNRRASFNALSKLLELSFCSLIFDLLSGFNLSIINAYL